MSAHPDDEPVGVPPRTPTTSSVTQTPYAQGYSRTLDEYRWARAHGFEPTQRDLVRAIFQAQRVYTSAQRGIPIAGRSPEWLHGRCDALLRIVRLGPAALSEQ